MPLCRAGVSGMRLVVNVGGVDGDLEFWKLGIEDCFVVYARGCDMVLIQC